MVKWLVGLVTLVALVALVRPADACGFWQMEDEEKAIQVGYLINSATISKAHRRLGAVYLDDEHPKGLRSVKDRKVVFDVRKGKLTKYGRHDRHDRRGRLGRIRQARLHHRADELSPRARHGYVGSPGKARRQGDPNEQ